MTAQAPEPATPAEVRVGLLLTTEASAAAIQAVADEAAAQSIDAVRAALFDSAPDIAQIYAEAAAELGAAWYDQLRDASGSSGGFAAEPVVNLDLDAIKASIAHATDDLWVQLHAEQQRIEADLQAAFEQSVTNVQTTVQKDVADAMRETITENAKRDDEVAGYQRFVRGVEACPFCRLLADKGAIYKKQTAYFAAHTNCHCLAGPVFKNQADRYPDADVMQYVAASRQRSSGERKRLRDYLENKYGAASASH